MMDINIGYLPPADKKPIKPAITQSNPVAESAAAQSQRDAKKKREPKPESTFFGMVQEHLKDKP